MLSMHMSSCLLSCLDKNKILGCHFSTGVVFEFGKSCIVLDCPRFAVHLPTGVLCKKRCLLYCSMYRIKVAYRSVFSQGLQLLNRCQTGIDLNYLQHSPSGMYTRHVKPVCCYMLLNSCSNTPSHSPQPSLQCQAND